MIIKCESLVVKFASGSGMNSQHIVPRDGADSLRVEITDAEFTVGFMKGQTAIKIIGWPRATVAEYYAEKITS